MSRPSGDRLRMRKNSQSDIAVTRLNPAGGLRQRYAASALPRAVRGRRATPLCPLWADERALGLSKSVVSTSRRSAVSRPDCAPRKILRKKAAYAQRRLSGGVAAISVLGGCRAFFTQVRRRESLNFRPIPIVMQQVIL